MRLNDVSFRAWLRTHSHKPAEERWLRELYPWPVLAQVDVGQDMIDRVQRVVHDEVAYEVTLGSIKWQSSHGTFRYRLTVESPGLGWHARSFSDTYDMCGGPDGQFVTLFNRRNREPLERIARAFFAQRWNDIDAKEIRSLAASRYLGACIASEVAREAYEDANLVHYPASRVSGGAAPMLALDDTLWIGYRFHSEHAYAWARQAASKAARVVALYFADTTYQFRMEAPANCEVRSVAELDASRLGGKYELFIRSLIRKLELPVDAPDAAGLEAVVRGETSSPRVPVSESDVHEALAALKRPCSTLNELVYQLSASVLLNAWIDQERRVGHNRKKFYAFKTRVAELVRWAKEHIPSASIWSEDAGRGQGPVLISRVDGVDFSFHAIPKAAELGDGPAQAWSGVRLKPIAPLVLAWARARVVSDLSEREPTT
jgi:hypothetical protein